MSEVLKHQAEFRVRRATAGLLSFSKTAHRLQGYAICQQVRALLVIVNQLSGGVEAFPPGKADTAGAVKALLRDVIPRHGAPESIESDRGAHFTANIIDQLYKSLGIDRNLHTPYHPRSLEETERMNRKLKGKISKICIHAALKWPEALNLALRDVWNAL